jgi:hypothetical protein
LLEWDAPLPLSSNPQNKSCRQSARMTATVAARRQSRLLHRQADFVKSVKHTEPRTEQRLCKRLAVGAIAVGAVLRNVARLGRKRNERAFRRPHLCKAGIDRSQAAPAERIVAAGVEHDEIEPSA